MAIYTYGNYIPDFRNSLNNTGNGTGFLSSYSAPTIDPNNTLGINNDIINNTNALNINGSQEASGWGSLGDWGKGLSAVGSVLGGFNDFRNFGEQKKNMNRNWDLSLGNFANQAQVVNNAQETDIRSRLSNAGMQAGPEFDAAVAAELARTGVSSDPYAAQEGTNTSSFLPSLNSNASNSIHTTATIAPVQRQSVENTVKRRSRGSL
jgi:hypothetical protein